MSPYLFWFLVGGMVTLGGLAAIAVTAVALAGLVWLGDKLYWRLHP